MTYCDNQALREEMYRAYSTRASDQGPNAGKWDNSPVMAEILALRHELAQLLGFESYAFKSLATKMAENPQQVLDFLTDLAKRARPQGEKELAQLRAFAKAEFGVDELQPWDIAYYSEKQKQHLYSISDEQLRPYFPENKAVNGLFEVVKRITVLPPKSVLTSMSGTRTCVSSSCTTRRTNCAAASIWISMRVKTNAAERGWTTAWARCVKPTVLCKSRSLT
jgi:oligopeptidase A